jgi:hypothetical protein
MQASVNPENIFAGNTDNDRGDRHRNKVINKNIANKKHVCTVGCEKTGNENFPDVNLVLSICEFIVCLAILLSSNF